MAPKDSNNCLRDVSNTRTLSHSPSSQGNVFKRLGTSPSMRHPNDLSKPPTRISPTKKSPMKVSSQLTPKRIQSPECLREYQVRSIHSGGSPSIDNNLISKIEQKGPVTNITFPASPTRTIFANERKIGGDGSLSRIRSRFTNGLLSPQRRLAPTPMKKKPGRENHDDSTNRSTKKELHAKNLFERLKEAEKDENESIQEDTTTQIHRKSVKFELPHNATKEAIGRELQELRKLVEEISKRQFELENRLSQLEDKQG